MASDYPIRVDFYLVNNQEPQASWLVACRLLEKAYQRGHRVFVYCDSQTDAEQLDELLWTYKDESFIPHNLQGEGPEPPPPVQIGYGAEPRGFDDILLNMSTTIPPYFTRFGRVMEIVKGDDAGKNTSREHYREYRAKGCELHTHTVEG
jgi:DNA polymerase III subunit chi